MLKPLPIMKSPLIALVLLGGLLPLTGREKPGTEWNVAIPEPISNGSPQKPARKLDPIDFQVLHSRTKQVRVTESPEMSGLPPIVGIINVTVQLVEDPQLSEPPPPLPPLPPDDPAVVARMKEFAKKYRGADLVFLSATIYDHSRTFLRIYPNGGIESEIGAWSNIDFNHFSGFGIFRITENDGTVHDCGLLMGIGNVNSGENRGRPVGKGLNPIKLQIPELPDLSAGGPAFVVTGGDVEGDAMDTLSQVHELYRKEGARMETDFLAREKARAERRVWLLANPPKPKDVTIRFWRRK